MTVTHKNVYIEIGFTAEDWDRDLAPQAMEYIKLLGKGNYKYQFTSKKWLINNTPENRNYLKDFRDRWLEEHKDKPILRRIDWDEFDIKRWLEEIFSI